MQRVTMKNYLMIGSAITLLLAGGLAGCKGSAPPAAQTAAPEADKAAARRLESKPAAASHPERVAVGTQQGGSRQGNSLALRNSVTTYAGKMGSAGYVDAFGGRARFDAPKGITTDGIHLYVADLNNHVIRKIEIATGKVTTLAGLAGKPGSADGKGSAARFNRPYGVSTDGTNLYVSDSNNHSIRQIEIESGTVTTIAGVPGEVGYTDGPLKSARFFIPEGITTDGSTLYVSDTHNHSIRKIDLESNQVTTIAGQSGAPGMVDEMAGRARFYYPKGMTTDGRNLYVVDFGNHRVRRISLNTGSVSTLAGGEEMRELATAESVEQVRFNYPTGITSDGRNLYVVDTFNRTVRKISLGNFAVTTLAGRADEDGAIDGMGSEARFREPVGITTDGIALYVTDSSNHAIRRIK